MDKTINNLSNRRRIIILVLILVIFNPALIQLAYWIGKKYPIVVTSWDESDILAFYGAITSSIGTIVLGAITLEQNRRLMKLEEDTFLLSNPGAALLCGVTIKELDKNSCNLQLHTEQIVYAEDPEQTLTEQHSSITLTCKIQPLDNQQHVGYVHVDRTLIWLNQNTSTRSLLDCKSYKQYYSRVAISKSYDIFEITIFMTPQQKSSFMQGLQEKCQLHVSLYLHLVTDRNVESELQCNAELVRNVGSPLCFFATDENPPMCFCKGAKITNSFVAETKGTMESLELRPIEQAKISCAKKLFNEMSTSNVVYHDVDSYQSLLNIMNSI